jgi:UDP-3-O-[3-hydroxymyristoyl] glucosamine N-acyltransferase
LEFTLKAIARKVGGKVVGDDRVRISGINTLDASGPGDLSFFFDQRYKGSLKHAQASAIIVGEENSLFKGPQVVAPNPKLAYARVAGLFALPLPRFPGGSDRAFVHEDSCIGKDVAIGPMVYVGEGAEVGDEVILFPGVYIGERVRIGARCIIYPNVTILHDCLVGNDVIIHAGTVIGSDGFGFVQDDSTSVKIPQLGIVQIDDAVEIGANNCVDRAALGRTWIQRGVKTDNLVQVAHNVLIGEDTIVVAQVGISGSARVGRQVIIGGQVGISDHVEIGDKAMIGSQSGVAKSIPSGELVSGSPTMPHRLWLRTSGLITRLPRMNERLRHLEKKIKDLETRLEQGATKP